MYNTHILVEGGGGGVLGVINRNYTQGLTLSSGRFGGDGGGNWSS